MREIEIRKGAKVRRVVAPDAESTERLRELLPVLARAERRLARQLGVPDVAHGFVAGRSPVTAAKMHVGPWEATVACDLRSWFDSVTREQVRRALVRAGEQTERAARVAEAVTHRASWHAQPVTAQGLPTSPSAANLVGARYDSEVVRALDGLLGPRGLAYVYTRYADDLAVSLRDAARWPEVVRVLGGVASRFGWALHPDKTHVYYARAGRRVVCGVAVDAEGVYPTRKAKRKARAAAHVSEKHWKAECRAQGLEAWVDYVTGATPRGAALARLDDVRPEAAAQAVRDALAPPPAPATAPAPAPPPSPKKPSRAWLRPAPPPAQPGDARGEWLWAALARVPRGDEWPIFRPYVRLWRLVCAGHPVWATAPNVVERELLGEYRLGDSLCEAAEEWLDEHPRGGFEVSPGVWGHTWENLEERLDRLVRPAGALARLAALED